MSGIDWRTMSDDEIDAALTERERRKLECLSRPSPAPWTATELGVRDAAGEGVCICRSPGGRCEGGLSLAAINARLLACGPDGVELAKVITGRYCSPKLTEGEVKAMAEMLLKKAGVV